MNVLPALPPLMTSAEHEAEIAPLLAGPEPRSPVKATPFVWQDPATIPPRQWLYGRHYIRKFVSQTVATSGQGKSSLDIAEALAIATDRPLLGVTPDERTNVWYWNGEDPKEELQRRIAALALHYEIPPKEIEGRFFVDTGRETKIVIAEQTKTGAKLAQPIVDAVIATITANNIGLLIIDPFVASHRVTENDNPAIELVAATWAEIADITNCSIELVHHARKTRGAEIADEDSRGGSALLCKVRAARTLNGMTEDEAARAGVEKRRSYFRVHDGKSNMTEPAENAEWHRLQSVALGNGDNVGVVTRWKWPDALDGVTVSDLRKAQAAVANGKWRESPQARDWVGIPIAKALKLDPTNRAHRAKIAALLKVWITTGMFVVVEGLDANREKRSFVEVGEHADD